MKKIVFLCLVFIFVGSLSILAQDEDAPNRKKITITAEQVQSSSAAEQALSPLRSAPTTLTTLKPIKVKFADPVENFFTLALNWPKANSSPFRLEYREKKRNKWSDWKPLPEDQHGEEESSVAASEMRQLEPQVRSIQIRIVHEQALPSGIQINLFNPVTPKPQGSAALEPHPLRPTGDLPELRVACPCPLPKLVSRTTWGAPRPCATESFSPVTHLIVHHSAGVNTSNNWAQVVLSIWDFHVNTRAFCDVGYNYLIDPNGVLYEGRSGGNNVIGAHFCNVNTGTMGVCLLGNFEEVEPTEAMLNTLAKILAWKSCNSNIDPLSKSVHARSALDLLHVSGHRDGCSTLCPGARVYNKLASVRSKVAAEILACNVTTAIEEPAADYILSIVPNPAQQSFRLEVQQGVRITQLELYNLLGQRMSTFQFDPLSLQVRCSEMPRGTYVVRTRDAENRIWAEQVILQ